MDTSVSHLHVARVYGNFIKASLPADDPPLSVLVDKAPKMSEGYVHIFVTKNPVYPAKVICGLGSGHGKNLDFSTSYWYL